MHNSATDPAQETCATDHAEYTGPSRQHELDHTDHTDHTDQESICPAWHIYIKWELSISQRCAKSAVFVLSTSWAEQSAARVYILMRREREMREPFFLGFSMTKKP